MLTAASDHPLSILLRLSSHLQRATRNAFERQISKATRSDSKVVSTKLRNISISLRSRQKLCAEQTTIAPNRPLLSLALDPRQLKRMACFTCSLCSSTCLSLAGQAQQSRLLSARGEAWLDRLCFEQAHLRVSDHTASFLPDPIEIAHTIRRSQV